MALSSRDRVLYARHLLLAEIGSAGQEQLCATLVDVPADVDRETATVALDYLRRAGVKVRSDQTALNAGSSVADRDASLPSVSVSVSVSVSECVSVSVSVRVVALALPDAAAVQILAGAPELRHAAAALLGAFAATEVIKQATGRGIPATFPAQLRFVSEDT